MSRVDAIGQEISTGDIVQPFPKSGDTASIGIVTRFNPVMIQINGTDNYDANRLLVVTSNLIALGRDSEIADLRTRYADKIDAKSPTAFKLPIRYVVARIPATDEKYLIKFEGTSVNAVLTAITAFEDHYFKSPGSGRHLLEILRVGTALNFSSHQKQRTFKWSANQYWDMKNAVFSARGLPAEVEAFTSLADPYIQLPADCLKGITK